MRNQHEASKKQVTNSDQVTRGGLIEERTQREKVALQ